MATSKRSIGSSGIRPTGRSTYSTDLTSLKNALDDEDPPRARALRYASGGAGAAAPDPRKYPAPSPSYPGRYISPYSQQAVVAERATGGYGSTSSSAYGSGLDAIGRPQAAPTAAGSRVGASAYSSDPRLRRLGIGAEEGLIAPPEPLGRPRPAASRYAQESILNPRRDEDMHARSAVERERERDRARDERLVLRSRHRRTSDSDSDSDSDDGRGRRPAAAVYTSAPPPRRASSGLLSSSGRSSNGGSYGSKGRQVGGQAGLQNLGNTCFMNSIMQCLANTPELAAFCIKNAGGLGGGKGLMKAFAEVVKGLWTSSGAVTPRDFLSVVGRWDSRFKGGRQHDSQEFLHSLLDGLQSDSNRIRSKPSYKELGGKGSEGQQADEAWDYARSWHDSPIDDVFRGQLQSTIECHDCRRFSHCFEPFVDLSLPIPKGGRTSIGHETTIEDCLALFTETEELSGRDGYKCEHCKKVTAATKRLRIYRYPPVLILHLKRFAQGSGFRSAFSSFSKNNATVRFNPEGLSLSKYCAERAVPASGDARGGGRPTYELFGVSNHSGSLGGGHYTAYCRNVGNGQWYHYNDSSVGGHSAAGTCSSSAYVLFYRLRDMPLPASLA